MLALSTPQHSSFAAATIRAVLFWAASLMHSKISLCSGVVMISFPHLLACAVFPPYFNGKNLTSGNWECHLDECFTFRVTVVLWLWGGAAFALRSDAVVDVLKR